MSSLSIIDQFKNEIDKKIIKEKIAHHDFIKKIHETQSNHISLYNKNLVISPINLNSKSNISGNIIGKNKELKEKTDHSIKGGVFADSQTKPTIKGDIKIYGGGLIIHKNNKL